MNERKLNRLRKKTQKMAALLRLSQNDESDHDDTVPLATSSAPVSDHEQMIQQLEDQMETSSRKRKEMTPNADLLCYDEQAQSEESSDIRSAYRNLVKRKKREEQALQLVEIYIDRHFLSSRRQQNLLYTNEAASLTSPLALHVSQVQQFIMYTVFGRSSMYRPKWCTIQFVTRVTQVMVIAVEGVSWMDVNISQPASWPRTHHHLLADHSIRIVSPNLYGGDLEEDLFMVPLTPSEIANHQSQHPVKHCTDESSPDEEADDVELDIEALTRTEDAFSRTKLLLSFADLVGDFYPIPCHPPSHNSENGLEGFEFTKESYAKVRDTSPLFALDCEMVETCDKRSSLASICVIDETFNVIYKTLVKPDKPISNYLTRFSGITPDILEGVTTTLRDVQRKLQELLPRDAILCGQSLNFDLAALKLFHPYIIDTSVCYNLKGMPHSKTGLKRLSAHFLKKDIQGGNSGHCPEEDARTTMELVLLKLKIGYSFGNVLADGSTATPKKLFKKLPKGSDTECDPAEVNGLLSIPSPDEDSVIGSTSASAKSLNGDKDPNVSKHTKAELAGPICPPSAANADSKNCDTSRPSDECLPSQGDSDETLIPQLSAFSKRNIPQMEVNMFDLVGHHDDNTAEICSRCLRMPEPQNTPAVTLNKCEKSRHVIKKAKKALKSGTRLVYASVSSPKDSKISTIKKHALSTDECVSDLWGCLLPGGLLCLVLSGTKQHHGSLMFGVKRHNVSSATDSQTNSASEPVSNEEDTDVYEMMYNCG